MRDVRSFVRSFVRSSQVCSSVVCRLRSRPRELGLESVHRLSRSGTAEIPQVDSSSAPPPSRLCPLSYLRSYPTLNPGTASILPPQLSTAAHPRACGSTLELCIPPDPTVHRSLAPTAAPPGGRLARHRRKSSRPTERRSRAPTAAPPGGRHPRLRGKSLVPRSAVRARPLQHLQVAAKRGFGQVLSSHGQPFARAHCSTSRWPPLAAQAQVHSSHGAPFARAHCSTSRWPPPRHRRKSTRPTERPFARAHCSTSRWPPSAAACKFSRPTDSRSRAPTAAPPGGRHARPWRKSARPTERRSRAPTAAPPGGRHRGIGQVPLIPRSAVRSRPLQHPQGGRRSRPRRKSTRPTGILGPSPTSRPPRSHPPRCT